MIDGSVTIDEISTALVEKDLPKAAEIARLNWPFEPREVHSRQYSPKQLVRLFTRDGFCDRYSGKRLVHPGMLRLLSILLPQEFPFQEHWKMTETHMAFWELFPTLDHVTPISRGGADREENWVTTSQLRNSAKSSWTLEELGWQLLGINSLPMWDGLTSRFMELVSLSEDLQANPYIHRWYVASLE